MSSSQTVSKQTLLISIAVSLLIGFLSGIIFSDKQGSAPSRTSAPQPPPDNSQTVAALELETAKNPDNVEAWTRLGHEYFDSDQPTKAIMAYNKSLELRPGDPDVITDLGVMYRRNGQSSIAIETFDKALQIDPSHQQAMFNKGVVLFYDLKDHEAAFNTWRALVQINPGATAPSGVPIDDLIDQLQNQVNQGR